MSETRAPTKPLSVTELTTAVKYSLNELFSGVLVQGEISDFVRSKSGHTYFSLKDSQAKLSVVMWSSVASRHRFQLEDGLEVICRGRIDVYPPRGNYQLIVERVEPVGAGELQLAFRQLHRKLNAEGLFDVRHKKPLPFLPRAIGVVTSPDGAAIRDFLQVLTRRFSGVEVLVVPSRVQGRGAERDIAQGIQALNRLRCPPDVLVVCRGGGSAEDLSCFNEELVCRAIFHSKIPVVSAVGHEIDVTLSDLVADVRALTPSEAAERIVPRRQDLLEGLQQLQARMSGLLLGKFREAVSRVKALQERPVLYRPLDRISQIRQTLDDLLERLDRSSREQVLQQRRGLEKAASQLDALSPIAILRRGYSVTTNEAGVVLRSIQQVKGQERLRTRLEDGTIESQVLP